MNKFIIAFTVVIMMFFLMVSCTPGGGGDEGGGSNNPPAKDKYISYKVTNSAGTVSYYVFVNAETTAQTFTVDADLTSDWCIADDDEAMEQDQGTETNITKVSAMTGITINGKKVTINPLASGMFKRVH